MEKPPEGIIILHKCTRSHDYMLYGMLYHTMLYYAILFFVSLLTAQKIKTLKKWRTCLEISSFYACAQKTWSDDVHFLRYGAQWSNGQTDGQTDRKSDT